MSAHHPSSSPRPDGVPPCSLDWAREAQLGPELAQAIRLKVKLRRRRRATVVAMTLCVLFATFSYWQPQTSRDAAFVADVTAPPPATVIAPERRTLDDGSRVELKAGAEVRSEFTAGERRVTLLRGEAHFEVTKDAQRPFIVAVRGVEVRAIGTAFSVGLGDRAVDVVVTEGVVALASPGTAHPGAPEIALPAERMVAGQHAVLELAAATTPAVQTLSSQQLSQRLSWRVPRLQFSGTPLAEVAALFRAHGNVRLRLADASLGSVRVSGVLRADNSDALLRLLAADHGIVAEPQGDELVLRRVQ
jgi:transmembrane sensor